VAQKCLIGLDILNLKEIKKRKITPQKKSLKAEEFGESGRGILKQCEASNSAEPAFFGLDTCDGVIGRSAWGLVLDGGGWV